MSSYREVSFLAEPDDLIVDLLQIQHILPVMIDHIAQRLGIRPTCQSPDSRIDVSFVSMAQEGAASVFQPV